MTKNIPQLARSIIRARHWGTDYSTYIRLHFVASYSPSRLPPCYSAWWTSFLPGGTWIQIWRELGRLLEYRCELVWPGRNDTPRDARKFARPRFILGKLNRDCSAPFHHETQCRCTGESVYLAHGQVSLLIRKTRRTPYGCLTSLLFFWPDSIATSCI